MTNRRWAPLPPRAYVTVALLVIGGIGLTPDWGTATGQSLYRYQDADGTWHFTDRPPAGAPSAEAAPLPTGSAPPGIELERDGEGGLRLHNRYHLPVQVVVSTDGANAKGVSVARVIPARASVAVAQTEFAADGPLRHGYVLGSPDARHRPPTPYRAPFAASTRHLVTQGFHGGITHRDAASVYAIDFAMPVGTGVFAARAGTVIEVTYAHYDGGTDLQRDGPRANLIRIVHDDGTYALYAHLDRASVSVRPGEHVRRGQRIAASGNTGFSSGPHLHFAVLRNAGGRVVSVPFDFAGPDGRAIEPTQGEWLTAYP
jgi:murein DD-endopeptidase MepM/ murein hydrolase activator NlpD